MRCTEEFSVEFHLFVRSVDADRVNVIIVFCSDRIDKKKCKITGRADFELENTMKLGALIVVVLLLYGKCTAVTGCTMLNI